MEHDEEAKPAKKEEAEPPVDKKDDLSERLKRKAVDGADEDLMAGILRMMGEASRKLTIEFDAGKETQTLHGTIMEKLDEAIQQAASQRRSSKGEQTWRKQKRKKAAQTDKKPKNEAAGKKGEGKTLAESTVEAAGRTPDQSSEGGDFMESRRGWGNLPSRERDEILQGVGERFLEEYRDWIEEYFQALQEAETP